MERVLRALLALPSERRTTELAALCAGEEWLQREVEALLRHEAAAERFLLAPAAPAEATSAADSAPADPLPGQRIGPYRLERRIASGGMGDVFMARRVEGGFEQVAAIKLMHAGTHTRELLRRFQQERQALAQLSHANIARLLDGGATADGRPYFAMEFVEGVSIAEYCDAHRYTVRQRLELFLKVCDAVHYAHRNLIIHRDLKPANILTTPAGQPVLLDFGIAKFLAPEGPLAAPETALTDARWMTPEYASPEQVLGAPLTTACDVYSLGVILYELLTGHRPYRVQGPSLLEVERAVCGSEPQRPSTAVTRSLLTADGEVPNPALTPELMSARRSSTPRLLAQSLRGDLDSVILMALQKEPDRRYRGVDALADDIRRHLAGVPVLARRATWAYYAQRFLRRNRVVASAVGLAVLALLGGTATTLW
ncbi:MAG: serine/threonine protein kinase, partial [Planctomycetes bacterium]|nr:serine/threonine protein kinase [Planctomycetota bacterium]